ncbi:sensor histidine kinase [Dielma fastidiosa]|uniref:sensor histidine kinase n=1 Tax=Dielma fastidiosa TaxID=1034346 RepID=UPI000EDF995A|nr:histidine kinase [Dielma fastidiosa]HAH93438.1 hypothetical protein [Dielma fastidiosa]
MNWKDKLKSILPYSISFRMVASISSIVLVVMVVSSVFTYFYFGKVLKEENLRKDYQVLKEDAQYLEMVFQEATTVAQNMLFDEQIQMFSRQADNDYFEIENIAEVMTRYTSIRHAIHSVLLQCQQVSVWNIFPFDSSAQEAVNQQAFYGFSKPYTIQYGNSQQQLIGYRSSIHDLNNPQAILGELTIQLDVAQLASLVHSWSQPENEISLVDKDSVLIASQSGINEEYLSMVDCEQLFHQGMLTVTKGTLLAVPIQSTPYVLLTYRSNEALQRKAWLLIPFFTMTTCLLLLLLFLLLYERIHALTQPIRTLQEGMVQFADGDMNVRLQIDSHDEMELLGNNFNQMVSDIDALMQKSIEDEKMKKKIKFDMMISKIHPHFIYNTLNSIIVMARKAGNDDVIHMVRSLILILQDSMSVHDDLLVDTLQRECSVIEAYVTIQNYRYKDKISLNFDIESDLERVKIAKNVLQPLVENAIFHGIVPKNGQGTIDVSVKRIGKKLCVQVHDDGVGMDQALVASIRQGSVMLKQQRQKHGDSVHSIALINVLERLEFLYGESLEFDVTSEANHGTCFTICFAYEEEKDNEI